jgi:hypothetical protein
MPVEAADGTIETIINANGAVVLEDVDVPAFVIRAGKLEDAPPRYFFRIIKFTRRGC